MDGKVKVKIMHDTEPWKLEEAFQKFLNEEIEIIEVHYGLCGLSEVEEGEGPGRGVDLHSRPYHGILVLYEEKK